MRRTTKQVIGTADRPRMIVSRSLNNVYVQIIDDENDKTLLGISSLILKQRANKDVSFKVGELVGEKAISLGIKSVVFDRAGRIYHGRIKAVADGARSKGLQF